MTGTVVVLLFVLVAVYWFQKGVWARIWAALSGKVTVQ